MPRPLRLPLLAAPIALLALALTGCQAASHAPLARLPRVDLARFMGDWYVIANIPTFIEKNAHNAVESYRLSPDGSIETTFTFRAGSFDGEIRRYAFRGYVRDRETNAAWGMQVLWPFRADYRIAWVAPDYSATLIAREARDHVWIMARRPDLPEGDYRRLVAHAASLGYDPALIRKVPQRWTAADGKAP